MNYETGMIKIIQAYEHVPVPHDLKKTNYVRMNKWSLILCLIFFHVYLQAQPPRGSMGMGSGNRPRGMRPDMGNRGEMRNNEVLTLDSFPPIPGITLLQRSDIGDIMAKEYKDISKYMMEKHQLMEKSEQSADKEKEKIQKKIDKVEQKIEKQIGKSNKKIQKMLSDEQYAIFLKQRPYFKFNRHFQPSNFRPPEGGFGERPRRGGGAANR
jgi:ElaB/YqjD/DUF883 family membrane-anchored ribosome-binding protein